MAENVPIAGETTKNGKQRKIVHFKILEIDDWKAETITLIVEANISKV
jgi:hypothetical protein